MKNIILITVISVIIAAAWIGGCSTSGYKKGKHDAQTISHLQKQCFYDSIENARLMELISGHEKTNTELKAELKALDGEKATIKAYYQNKIKYVLTLSGKEIDSVYRLYASDSSQAIVNFYSLDECLENVNVLNKQVLTYQEMTVKDSTLITQLTESIKKEQSQEIQLRAEFEQTTLQLQETENKLKRRTMQRNVTWASLLLIGIGIVVLN